MEEIKVVLDKTENWPSFFKVLMCSLDYSLIMIYTLLFIELELLWGGDGNSILSIFITYLAERIFRKIRHDMGVANLCKKAHLDDRFLG